MGQYGNGNYVEHEWLLEDCTIGRGVWRNFNDSVGSFVVFLPQFLYEELKDEGWYVKCRNDKYEEGDTRMYQLEVAYGYDMYPPNITMHTADGSSVVMNAENIRLLQTADFERVNLVIRPHNWKKNGDSGVKAYVKEMEVWLKPSARRSANASFDVDDD